MRNASLPFRQCVATLAAAAVALQAQEPKLPVERVVLYKNGIGYFEHVGKVRGKQDVTISFTSAQLNDVLKSLTVLDLNGGRITGVEYGSSAPADRQLGDLRLPVGEKATLAEFLAALRGAKVEIKNGAAALTGRILSVERKTRITAGAAQEADYVSLLTDTGEIRTTEVSSGFSVRLVEAGLAGKVDRLLDIASRDREPDVRRMRISADGTGERGIFVSYISEVPVWKSTYRIMLDSKNRAKPLLQGWAIVDNTVGQDWENVQLSLVAGAPQSFVQNLSQPLYTRRPVVALPDAAMTVPQTFQSTLTQGGQRLTGRVTDATGVGIAGATVRALDAQGNPIAMAFTRPDGRYELAGLPGAVDVAVESPGFLIQRARQAAGTQDFALQGGGAAQSVEVSAEPSIMQTMTSDARRSNLGSGAALGSAKGIAGGVGSGRGSGVGSGAYSIGAGVPPPPPAATGQTLGDLFEYKLKQPVTIEKNRSAMVPIMQTEVGAEKVSVWNERSANARPTRALLLLNASGMTLDGGSFSVIDEDTFAGEGIMEPLRPGEKRLISYATDLGVTPGSKTNSQTSRVSRVYISRGTLFQSIEQRWKKTYTFRNEDTSPRVIIVEHPVQSGVETKSEAKPVETTASYLRYRVPVEPKQTTTLVVEQVQPITSSYLITNIDANLIASFVTGKSITPAVEAELRKILAQKQVIAAIEREKEQLAGEQSRLFDDQERLRENMKALKGSPEEKQLIQRYTQQLNQQETRLEAIRKELGDREAKLGGEQAKLDRMIGDLSLDVTL